jgi:hypothetical protein
MVTTAGRGALPRVRVSDNRRFLVTENGAPFFWLGDTAWELFHRLRREEAERYFANRQARRFTVIQAVALAEFRGLTEPNAYGDLPLIDTNPARPNEAYFRLVDEYIDLAAAHGLYVGLLPTWGDKVTPIWGAGPRIFDAAAARGYGRFLGDRYRDRTNVLWVLGGDRPAEHDGADYRPVWRAMAEGIRAATGGPALMTYHPMGGRSSSEWLHGEAWLDVNMMQSGHGAGRDVPVWEMIGHDYNLSPAKPVLDGEPNYEDHPVSPWPTWNPANGYFRDHDVRKQAYRSVFAGGCGVTYGHHSMWQFCGERYEGINHADRGWLDALDRPGASQLAHLRSLMESRPYLHRIPDQSLIAGETGERGDHVQATADADGSYAFVYLPRPLPVTVDLIRLAGSRISAWWYDPVTGEASLIGQFGRANGLTFTPPGHRPDWVLVLDDASRGYGPPGGAAAQ